MHILRKLIFTFFPLALLLASYLSAQETPEIRRERVFTGEGLYGFMNGAADLFFEYGFKSLINRDISYKGEDFTVDIYEMPNRNDAFGIYSMHVFRCQQADSIGAIDCASPYQLQAVVDNFYISIVFPSGSARAQQLAGELIPLFVKGENSSLPDNHQEIKAENSVLPDIPPDIAISPPYSGIVKYLKGPIAISSTSRDLTALLKDVAFRGVWFRADPQTKSYKAAILFSSPEAKEAFEKTIPDSDIFLSDDNLLLIKRKEIEPPPSKSGEFGF